MDQDKIVEFNIFPCDGKIINIFICFISNESNLDEITEGYIPKEVENLEFPSWIVIIFYKNKKNQLYYNMVSLNEFKVTLLQKLKELDYLLSLPTAVIDIENKDNKNR